MQLWLDNVAAAIVLGVIATMLLAVQARTQQAMLEQSSFYTLRKQQVALRSLVTGFADLYRLRVEELAETWSSRDSWESVRGGPDCSACSAERAAARTAGRGNCISTDLRAPITSSWTIRRSSSRAWRRWRAADIRRWSSWMRRSSASIAVAAARSGGMKSAAAAARVASPFWLATQTSTLPSANFAVQFIGSMVAWFRKGAP